MRPAVAIVLLALAAPARADDHLVLGDGYELVIDHHQLFVVRGKQRAPLGRADTIGDATKAAHRRVHIEASAEECSSIGLDVSFDELEARLVNAEAYGRHVHKDYAAAAAGFARAAALAPSWPIAAYNLASADQLRGDLDGAIAALAPWLAKQPVATYLQIARDPELRPLLARPELRALRPTGAGTAKIDKHGLVGGAAYSPAHHALAFTHTYDTGNLKERSTATDIAIVDVGGAPIDTLSPDHDTETVLDDLGFSPVHLEQASGPSNQDDKLAFTLAAAKLYVVVKNGTARAFRGDRELGHADVSEHFLAVGYSADAHVVVLSWVDSSGPDWCADRVGTAMIAIP